MLGIVDNSVAHREVEKLRLKDAKEREKKGQRKMQGRAEDKVVVAVELVTQPKKRTWGVGAVAQTLQRRNETAEGSWELKLKELSRT